MLDNIFVQLIFLFFSCYLGFSAIHEYVDSNDLFFGVMGTIWLIFGIPIHFIGLIYLAKFNDDDNDNGGNGGKKKIYPDNSDYSEKVLELYK